MLELGYYCTVGIKKNGDVFILFKSVQRDKMGIPYITNGNGGRGQLRQVMCSRLFLS
jgi:hypothetical protein